MVAVRDFIEGRREIAKRLEEVARLFSPWPREDWDVQCGCGSKPMGSHFGVGAPPILEPILVGIGMFTGGTGF